ncbi:MAG: MFS transporter [Dehalococcoidia bacterium]
MAAPVEQATPVRLPLLLALVTAAVFLAFTTAFMLGPLLVDLADEFNTTVSVTGQLVAITSVSWGIIALLSGPFSDVYGRRPLLILGLGLMGVATLAAALSWNYGSLALFRFFTSFGAALVPTSSMAAIADYFPAHIRGRALGLMVSGSSLAVVLGVPAVALVADYSSWRWSFGLMGGAALLVMVLFILAFPRRQQARQRIRLDFRARLLEPLHHGLFRRVLLANLTLQLVAATLWIYISAFLMERYGLSLGQVAGPFAVVATGLVVGALLGGRVADTRYGLGAAAVALAAGGAVAWVLFGSGPGLWLSVALGALLNILMNVARGVFMKTLLGVVQETRASLMGLLVASNQAGNVLGSAVGGLVIGLSGFPMLGLFLLLAGLAGAGVTATLVARRASSAG